MKYFKRNKIGRKITIIFVLFLVLGGLTGCGNNNQKDNSYSYYDTSDGRRIWMKN